MGDEDSGGFMAGWADALTSLWMLSVAVIYFGGFFVPGIGAMTAPAGAGHAMMLLIAVGTLLTRRIGRSGTRRPLTASKTEDGHG